MTKKEVQEAIKNVPIGARLELLKKSGQVMEVILASHEVAGTERKDYGSLVVPALPAALTVQGGTRFGSFRVEVGDLVKVAWVD